MTPILTVSGNPPDPDGLHYTLDRRIVAIGYANGPRGVITRRVLETVSDLDPALLVQNYTLFGQASVTVSGGARVGSASLPAPIHSNKDVSVSLSNGGVQCGNVTYGPPGSGGSFTGTAGNCPPGQTVSQASGVAPLPSPAAPASNNASLLTLCAVIPTCSFDTTSRNLKLNGPPAATLTLPPGTYDLCSLSLSGSSTLVISDATAPVVIYIDAPGSNGCSSSGGGVSVAGNSTVMTPTAGVSPENFQLLVAGLPNSLDASSTAVNLAGNSSLQQASMTLDAPYSQVSIGGGTNLNGAVIGDQVTVGGSAQLSSATGLSLPTSGAPALYKKGAYTECIPAVPSAPTPPDQGC
jgi:hypothetical protein